MDISTVQLIFEDKKLSIILKLNSLIYKDVDLAPYMPSGIQLYFETFYEYDFRMFKDSLFMRLKGQYYSKEEFLDEIFNAVKDPILYIQIHDPSYLIRQIDQLRDDNNVQNKKFFELSESHIELQENFEILLERHNSLLTDYTSLYGNHELTKDELKKLTNGVISLNNTGFFGGLNQFNEADIEEIIKIKTNNPQFTVKETALSLKTLELKVPTRVIEAVFMIYFKEFPQNKK